MTGSLPDVTGLSWARIRDRARELTRSAAGGGTVGGGSREDPAAVAVPDPGLVHDAEQALDDPRPAQRMLGVYVLGFSGRQRPELVEVLRRRVPTDPSWEVQEALAQAFDAWCESVGYQAALPTIDAWLDDEQPNARRAASEGLRPWTSRRRAWFAAHPDEAVRRLAALRGDPSDYVRHSAGNALRDIRRAHGELVDAETATWDLDDPRERFTYERVLKAR